MKAMYKSELARLAGVSANTFRRYLNSRREVLAAMGVSPRSQTLPPRAVRYVVEDYCIDLPDEMQ
jgi:predicted RecB family endonuclease